jgi:hypothetical protein
MTHMFKKLKLLSANFDKQSVPKKKVEFTELEIRFLILEISLSTGIWNFGYTDVRIFRNL